MTEKRKDPVLRYLRIIQLIEADIQYLMRILVIIRNKFRIEKDNRVSKSNYKSRPHYSIENAILEKRLVCNCSLLIGNYNIYNIIDL